MLFLSLSIGPIYEYSSVKISPLTIDFLASIQSNVNLRVPIVPAFEVQLMRGLTGVQVHYSFYSSDVPLPSYSSTTTLELYIRSIMQPEIPLNLIFAIVGHASRLSTLVCPRNN